MQLLDKCHNGPFCYFCFIAFAFEGFLNYILKFIYENFSFLQILGSYSNLKSSLLLCKFSSIVVRIIILAKLIILSSICVFNCIEQQYRIISNIIMELPIK